MGRHILLPCNTTALQVDVGEVLDAGRELIGSTDSARRGIGYGINLFICQIAGYPLAEVKECGRSFTRLAIREAGYPCDEAVAAGYVSSIAEAMAAGFVKGLKAAG